MTDERTAAANGIEARYDETDSERRLAFEATDDATAVDDAEAADDAASAGSGATAAIAQNREGYAMLKVRPTVDGDELERYYGFDMALDHAAELLGVSPGGLPVPEAAEDMGM